MAKSLQGHATSQVSLHDTRFGEAPLRLRSSNRYGANWKHLALESSSTTQLLGLEDSLGSFVKSVLKDEISIKVCPYEFPAVSAMSWQLIAEVNFISLFSFPRWIYVSETSSYQQCYSKKTVFLHRATTHVTDLANLFQKISFGGDNPLLFAFRWRHRVHSTVVRPFYKTGRMGDTLWHLYILVTMAWLHLALHLLWNINSDSWA